MFYVTDLRHFEGIESDVEAPAPAVALARYLRRIVRAATASATPGSRTTALPCRRRPQRRRCPGNLRVERQGDHSRIEWSCPSCGEGGSIDGWQDGEDDLSLLGAPASGGALRLLVIPEDSYGLLLDVEHLDDRCVRMVYSAMPRRDGVALSGTDEELTALSDVVAYGAEDAPSSNSRRRWRQLAGCLEPRHRSWLEQSTDVVVEELGELGLTAPEAPLSQMIQRTLAEVARMLRISEISARRYVDDEQLRTLAREAALELAAERPGADLYDQPRTIPVTLRALGRMIAGLAEGARLRRRSDDDLGADGSLELVSFLAQVLAEWGAERKTLPLPEAAVVRAARLLETNAELFLLGPAIPPGLPAGTGDDLAKAFVSDAMTLHRLVTEHGGSAGPTPDS